HRRRAVGRTAGGKGRPRARADRPAVHAGIDRHGGRHARPQAASARKRREQGPQSRLFGQGSPGVPVGARPDGAPRAQIGRAVIARSRHRPFYLAVLAAALSCVSALQVAPLLVVVIAANAFFAVYVALSLARLARLRATALRTEAAGSDFPVWVIFLVTVGAVAAALAALFVMLNASQQPNPAALLLAFLAVPLGWLTIHLMAAIHYAHLYWEASHDGKPAKGLDFPGT